MTKPYSRDMQTRGQVCVLVVLAIALMLTAAPAMGLTPPQKCVAAKLKAAAKKADSKAKCTVKTKFATPADTICLQKAEDAFGKAYTKAEAPGACTRTGDAAAVEATVDAFVAALVQALQPSPVATQETPAQKCAVAKLKAATKKAVAKTTCQIKNLSLANGGLLAICYGSAEDKFDTAFANAEKPSACTTAGDAAAIEAMVDAFVAAIAAGPPTPTPTRTPTLFPGQATPTPPPTPTPCTGFHDNGDGTITDCGTKLMWEKKQTSPGLQDEAQQYAWAGTCSVGGALCQVDVASESACNAQTGGAVGCAVCSSGVCNTTNGTIWQWLALLNSFNHAGHSDWRIPTLGELQTIVASPCPGGGQPCVPLAFRNGCTPGCTVTTCSCTEPNFYWSSETNTNDPSSAFVLDFSNGNPQNAPGKTQNRNVRAVRGGS